MRKRPKMKITVIPRSEQRHLRSYMDGFTRDEMRQGALIELANGASPDAYFEVDHFDGTKERITLRELVPNADDMRPVSEEELMAVSWKLEPKKEGKTNG